MKYEVAHVCNRGIDKKDIFLNKSDKIRFVETLYRINNKEGSIRYQGGDILRDLPEREKIVDILKWSLLPNHYHLLLHECIEGGIVEFTKRLGNSYTKYFNIKYKRSGYLFQNAAKIHIVDSEAYQTHIPFYIELNPIESIRDRIRDKNKINTSALFNSLKMYKWCSLGDYYDLTHFPEIIDKETFYNIFETTSKRYREELQRLILQFKKKSTWQVDFLKSEKLFIKKKKPSDMP